MKLFHYTTAILMFALLAAPLAQAQLVTNADPSAALEVDSTTKGFLPPRMSEAQRDAIATPATGLLIYNISTQKLNYYNGVEWIELTSAGARTVVLSATGKTWLAKNLGADQIATSSTDAASYGYLYQWGRNSDGHQFRTSSTAAGPVASGSEGSNFITIDATPNDWLNTQDNTRWNGATKGAHDPCPSGFRVPTETELNNERLLFPSNDSAGAFASVLKLTVAGYRNRSNGALTNVDTGGHYWASTVDGTNARRLNFNSSNAAMFSSDRALGFSVRCLKD